MLLAQQQSSVRPDASAPSLDCGVIRAYFRDGALGGLVALVARILILVFPRFLDDVAGIYLVLVGLADLVNVQT